MSQENMELASPTSAASGGGKEKGKKKTANEKALAKLGHVASKSSEAGNFGSRYIIVFVPVGSGASSSSGGASATTGGGGGNAGGGFGGFRAGKKGGGVIVENNNNNNNMDDNASVATTTTSSSTHDGASSNNHSQHNANAAAAAAYPPGPIAHSSKEVKELYHKFLKDFPNGRTVILGTLLDADVSTISPLKNQEWKAFLHNLGGAVVDGFGDRVRRYDEELRRLDSKRAAFVRKFSGEHSKMMVADKKKTNGHLEEDSGFDLSHFFLVKESLAFTYEQMQLPGEAKLQYEELNAFLPEEAWRQLAQQASAGGEDDGEEGSDTATMSPSDLAMAGDWERFRKLIKSSGRDLRGVSSFVPQYMYSREVRLLFQMGSPVDVLNRSKEFLVKEYRSKLLDVAADFGQRWKKEIERIGMSSSEHILAAQSKMKQDRLKKEAEIEAWALSSCWDVKCAAEHYFTLSPPDTTSEGGKKDDDTAMAAAAPTVEGQDAARCIAELLEFAILRLIRLGDLALGEEKVNPIRRATSERPADTLKPWVPWKELRKQRGSMSPERKKNIIEAWTINFSPDVSSWVRNAFSNSSTYEDTYLELAKAAVYINRRSGRFRFASRLEDHRAEVLISRGEYNLAADVLSNNVGACARDQWNRAHYWRIFRLACCQRVSGDVLAYLETLTQSFNPRLSSVAPKKTASLFQNDLEALITDAAVAEPRWGAFPFLETELSIESETAGKSSQPLPFLRRKLSKYLTYVGDELRFSLSINSHLPRAISVNGIRLYLVTLATYEQVYRGNGTVSEEDAFRILSIDAPITIEPGKNQFSFPWQPMTYNVYVLATVEIQWKEASFFYDSALLRKPLVGLDIQPSEPTQTIELNPLFLIPGHVQNVRLVFHSGSDIITGGAVTLICSEGLQVVPPKTDQSKLEEAWRDECVIPLDACEPGKKIVITTLVKSTSSRSGNNADDVQEMMAKVETSYRHKSYDSVMEKGEEPDSNPMKTLLEAMVTTLDRPALAVDGSEAFVFDEDRVMVNVSLHCNTPVPFFVKEWNLDLPSPLVVEEDGDLNKGMFQHAIPEGDMLLFGFKCLRADDSDEPSSERPILRVVLQDDFGKTFLQVLPLNLDDIYKQLRKEDEYAELHNATAELVCSIKEGSVGHPVPFVYNLNLQSLISPKARRSNMSVSVASEGPRPTVLYTIISEGSDWIVSGKVQGLIDSKRSDIVSIPFRGIPTRSGLLRHFPEIIIEYLPITTLSGSLSSSQTPPITVLTKTPERFKSLAFTNSLSLAVPQDLEEF